MTGVQNSPDTFSPGSRAAADGDIVEYQLRAGQNVENPVGRTASVYDHLCGRYPNDGKPPPGDVQIAGASGISVRAGDGQPVSASGENDGVVSAPPVRGDDGAAQAFFIGCVLSVPDYQDAGVCLGLEYRAKAYHPEKQLGEQPFHKGRSLGGRHGYFYQDSQISQRNFQRPRCQAGLHQAPRTASRPGSQREGMGLSVGPSGAFPSSWLLRAGTARGPIPSLMQPWGHWHVLIWGFTWPEFSV